MIWFSKADELSTNARDNVTTLLVNTAWSVDEAAGRGDEYAHPFESDPAGGDSTLTGLTVQPQYNRSALAKLIGRISDDKDGTNFNAVSQAVGILNENRLAHAAAQASQGHDDYLPSAMEKTSAAQGYLISSAQAAVESNAKNRDERNKSIIDMMMGITSFIAATICRNNTFHVKLSVLFNSSGIKPKQNDFLGTARDACVCESAKS